MTLDEMPLRVAELIHSLDVHTPPANGEWAAIEHLCHLRDIEAEGYNVRIAQLLNEDDPLLRDLDGDALARERRYREQHSGSTVDLQRRGQPEVDDGAERLVAADGPGQSPGEQPGL